MEGIQAKLDVRVGEVVEDLVEEARTEPSHVDDLGSVAAHLSMRVR